MAMVILGLTGSIGMGKSTAAAAFRCLGVAVHEADRAVHEILENDRRVVTAIAARFPGTVRGRGVDRAALAARVFDDAEALARLEGILHPRVAARQRRFLETAARHRRRLVVLEVPLLFETGGYRRCDAVVVVSAPGFVQARRVLARAGMTGERFASILARQLPDAEKRRRADFVVNTGLGRSVSLQAIRKIVTVARRWRGRHWPPRRLRPAGCDRQR